MWASIAALHTSRAVEHESLLFVLRDLVVLIVIVIVILWLAYELGRRGRQ